jgi:hypothetical protein
VIAVLAGFFGAILGMGGAIIIAPALTLLLDIDIRYAIGAPSSAPPANRQTLEQLALNSLKEVYNNGCNGGH